MKPLTQNSMVSNRYLVVQLIGKGGMGEVYLAVDQRLGSAVALKRTIFHEDEALGNAFEREAKILGRLRHPVLPKVIDHFIETDGQFLVMEHISGDDLQKRLENAGKPFPLSWVMFWADQLLDALNYLHSHEPPIIHRDIKPQNLKLTDDNHVVLLDFGLSKDFDTKTRDPNDPISTGSVVGFSPHFASMEQVRGTGTDARSDIYSLSATLYQLLTNTMPADALSRADELLGGKKDPLPAIQELNTEVPAWVSDVILKGLALRQDERFATAAEMQKALRRAFNKGKATSAGETLILPTDDKPTPAAPSSFSELGEVETHVRMEKPELAEPRQSDVKTEIFSAPVLPTEDEEGLQPAPPIAKAAAAAATGSQPAPAHVAAPLQPKRSRAGLMIGGLVGLLLLGGMAAGGGWYVYNNFYAGTPVPSPLAAPSVEPSPSPSAEVIAETNSSSTLTNSSLVETNTDSGPDAVNSDPATRATPPAVTRANTGKTTSNPTAKATPKPKAKDDRTVIIQ